MKEHVCIDCKALAEKPVTEAGLEVAPKVPRPAPHGGPRSRRCTTHFRAHAKAVRAKGADARVVKVYGLEPGEYEELLAFQGGTCAIPSCRARGPNRWLNREAS